jgi:hypothetical protein
MLEGQRMKDCKFKDEFLKMLRDAPEKVVQALSYFDVIKPLIWRDLRRNGGKFGYRGIAKKYGITESQARTTIKNIENQQ